jgi:hypothetical protein
MLCTSKEKLALYIGTNYGDDACQEWLSEKQLVLQVARTHLSCSSSFATPGLIKSCDCKGHKDDHSP